MLISQENCSAANAMLIGSAKVVGILTVVLMAGNGCSVYMAAKRPDAKDLNVFAVGTPRSMVLSEIGQPLASE